ncbi:putative esterase [Methanocella paludicola SANAE]|uniref:Esterase n=1 Tax=Methanocella paludicola (strain DSM 17711 / JCM 13418 / NBRC 101707 / SANAE) TaxID=304371 RepID=D1YW29_METPS|nr:alpha/beta hydrolase [Methanocella paludicola]BAI60651.1 putative esterase [Methanocella paludicola SANAE]
MATIGTITRGIEPATRSFLEKINASKGPQIYEMSVEDARDTLSSVQAVEVSKMPVDVEETVLPVGPEGRVNVHIVRPKGSMETLPVVMYYHGGGWVLGDYNIFERLVGELANKANSAIVFVDYSRSPGAKYPVAIEEDYAALEYVAGHGKELNVDSSRLAIAGDSVGGNMTAVVSMMAKQRQGPKIGFQVLFYPVTDASFDNASYRQFATGYWLTREAMKWFWDNYLPDRPERNNPMASPLQAPVDQLKGLPPALVVTNEYDVLRDEGEAYAHKLMEAGVRTTGVRFLGAIHDMVMLNAIANTPAPGSAIDLASDMLRRSFAK